MDRIELVRKLLLASTAALMTQTGYLERPRNYTAGDSLYMREVHFIVAVGPGSSPTMSEMARRLDVTQGAVSQTAARLEKKGYVTRAKAAEDKRLTTVSLTPKGEALCQEHIAYDQERYRMVSEFYQEFTDQELERFIAYEEKKRAMFTIRQ